MKTNIAIILASKDFRDEEYFITKEVLEKQGNKIKSVSNEKRAIVRLYSVGFEYHTFPDDHVSYRDWCKRY